MVLLQYSRNPQPWPIRNRFYYMPTIFENHYIEVAYPRCNMTIYETTALR